MKLPNIDHPVFVFKLPDKVEQKTADYLEFALQDIVHNVMACHLGGEELSYTLHKTKRETSKKDMHQLVLTALTVDNTQVDTPIYSPHLMLIIASIHEFPIKAAYEGLKEKFLKDKVLKKIHIWWKD